MPEHESDPDKILAGTSQGFRELHAHIGDLVAKRYPGTRLEAAFGMAAWVAPVHDPPAAEDWKGTMPRDVLTVGPTEKAAGITVHVWHPNDPYALRTHETMLKEAGFKVMVGCLQWNKKAPFPLETFAGLLDQLPA